MIGTLGAEFEPYTHLEELVGRPLDRDALDTRRRAREDELCELEDLRPGIEEYREEAERLGLATAIVSSSSRRWIEKHLDRLGRTNGWDAIVTADGDPERAKPRPTLYLEALDALKLEPPRGDRVRRLPERCARREGGGTCVRRDPESGDVDAGARRGRHRARLFGRRVAARVDRAL